MFSRNHQHHRPRSVPLPRKTMLRTCGQNAFCPSGICTPCKFENLSRMALLVKLKERSDRLICKIMNEILGNYLRPHRRKAGLSQRELGLVLGYEDYGQISRHERSRTTAPLIAAFAYQVIYKVPVSDLFPGLHAEVARMIERNLAELEEHLQQRSGKGRRANETAQKLTWLMQRRESS